MRKPTEKQKLFCKYYVIKFNGAWAAEKAGVPKKSAKQMASKWLTKVYVQKEIKGLSKRIIDKIELTQDMVIKEIRDLAFSDIKNYIQIGPKGIKIKDLKDIDTKALSGASMKITKGALNIDFKMHNKPHCLEMLGRHFGTFEKDNKIKLDLNNLTINFADIDFEKKKV